MDKWFIVSNKPQEVTSDAKNKRLHEKTVNITCLR